MTEKAESWKRISSKDIADCRVFRVREDFCERESDGARHSFFVVENPDWVNVIALTKNREVVLIEQFRYGTEEIILEIPGGIVDAGEAHRTAARRELLEETGFSSDEFIFLGKSHPNPAIQNNTIYHYLALGCQKTDETNFDEYESAVTKLVSLEQIPHLIESEQITHSLVLAGFYKLMISEHFQRLSK
ncbi:MAG TPA: NUDIX hydrolase [Pyrinomonadaceae bacterium]|jgi:8-oxo-dGTP pyrophosphatase MutT (NUDIX family)